MNLASLLIPDYDASKASLDTVMLRRQQRDHRLERVLNISHFCKAFGIFKRVICEAFPQRRDEFDLYEVEIGNIHEHYGEGFLQISCPVFKQAAVYMEKGIKIDWFKRHKGLFQLLVGGTKTKLCDHSSLPDHQSPFCPTQINVQPHQKPKLAVLQIQLKIHLGDPESSLKEKKFVITSMETKVVLNQAVLLNTFTRNVGVMVMGKIHVNLSQLPCLISLRLRLTQTSK